MASNSISKFESLRRVIDKLDPVLTPLGRAAHYIASSFFRVLIVLGLLMFALAVVGAEGIVAAHLGIYAASAVGVGVVGRAIVWWKLRDSR